jgi:hypothetical protein
MLTALAIVAVIAQSPTVEAVRPALTLVYPMPDPHPAPDLLEQVTVGSLFASSSISMVPVWLTAVCTTDRTCIELNPIMRRVMGDGPVRAVAVKAGLSFVAHYGIWRLDVKTPKQRIVKLIAALALLGFNVWDAVHDVRVMRAIDQRLGR